MTTESQDLGLTSHPKDGLIRTDGSEFNRNALKNKFSLKKITPGNILLLYNNNVIFKVDNNNIGYITII